MNSHYVRHTQRNHSGRYDGSLGYALTCEYHDLIFSHTTLIVFENHNSIKIIRCGVVLINKISTRINNFGQRTSAYHIVIMRQQCSLFHIVLKHYCTRLRFSSLFYKILKKFLYFEIKNSSLLFFIDDLAIL